MKTIVFFGTYLSNQTGSRPSSETIAGALASQGNTVKMVSRKPAILPRILDCIWTASTVRADIAVLDVFSSRVHHLTSIIASILAWRGIPFVAVLRGGALLEKLDKIERTLTPVLEKSSQTISPSGFLSAGFAKRGYEVEVVPHALMLDRFPYRERQRPRGVLRLLWVRAFTAIYRPTWPIEIISYLKNRGVDCRLTMVGPDKGLLGAAKAKAVELGVTDHVEFTGPVPNNELHTYYHAHDFLLNTTEFESFGVALVEAASTGLPIVSAAVGEVQHAWQDEENIFLVPGESSEDFSDRIADLQESDVNGTRYCHVSRKAHEKVAEYAIENIMPRWQSIIESVSDGRTR